MTDEEKLEYIKAKWNAISAEWKTLAEFKSFLNNITKAKIMNALKDRVQHEIDTHSQYTIDESTRVSELIDLKDDLEKFLS